MGMSWDMERLVMTTFPNSAPHYAIMTGGGAGTTAQVGCYVRDDPADEPYNYYYCIANFYYAN